MADLRDFTGKNRKFTGTIGERISTGTTAERDTSFGGGTLRFNTSTNLMEYYTGTEWKSIDAPPTITFVNIDSGGDTTSGTVDNEASGNTTILVKGSLFDTTGGNVTFVGTGETLTPATQTRNSSSLFTCVLPASSFDDANSPYTVKMTNGSGLSAELVAGISADQASPVFATAAGTLGTITNSTLSSYSLSTAAATDADGDTITYSITIGSLPPGLSFNTSTAAITGTATAVVSNTTSTFTVSAATTASTSTRQFSITVQAPVVTSYTSGSGNFSVPVGVTSVDVLVVAGGGGGGTRGGGGGAGGLIYRPGFPVTPGGTVAYSVGAGGNGDPAQNQNPGQTGQDSVFGTLTAKGGGYGAGHAQTGGPGGSGGGGGRDGGPGRGGPASQPGQPGDSGTYGFGNAGGTPTGTGSADGGGGGGAGAPGNNGVPDGTSMGSGRQGGAGRSYDISGSSVFYAGGGGAGSGANPSGTGGQGGGGQGSSPGNPSSNSDGTANRGGGGGSTGDNPSRGGNGGSGIVIIKY